MAVSKANQRAVNKYVKNNYDRINVTMSKGKKETIQAAASAVGESVNAFINGAIDMRMGRKEPTETTEAFTESRAVPLPVDTLEAAREAAKAAGETLPVFVTRAVETQIERDKLTMKMKGGAQNE